MESIQRIRQINEENALKQQEAKEHFELLDAQTQTQEVILKAVSSLISFISNNVGKTQVVNQLREIGTPDALKVVEAVDSLHETLKTHENTDITPLVTVMNSALDELKQIPKSFPEEKEDKDYSKQFTALTEAVKAVEKVISAQELHVEAPVVNVPETQVNIDAPDLSPINKNLQAVEKAIKAIIIPEVPVFDTSNIVKEQKAQTKVLKEILDRPIGGITSYSNGGGGGGRATPYEDSNGIPAFVTLDSGAIPVTSGGIASYQVNDIEEDVTSYFGFSTTAGSWMIKALTDTSVSYATVSNNGTVTSYTDAWTNRATLTFERYDQAF